MANGRSTALKIVVACAAASVVSAATTVIAAVASNRRVRSCDPEAPSPSRDHDQPPKER